MVEAFKRWREAQAGANKLRLQLGELTVKPGPIPVDSANAAGVNAANPLIGIFVDSCAEKLDSLATQPSRAERKQKAKEISRREAKAAESRSRLEPKLPVFYLQQLHREGAPTFPRIKPGKAVSMRIDPNEPEAA